MTELLNVADVARIFRTTRTGIYQRLYRTRQGTENFPLPLGGKGKRHLWTQEAIEKFIKAKEHQHGNEN